ncbi:ATP-binding protein [Dokdonella sp.]|uniref:ATP-binding protein n=1 Tax=Dokdonella sp. TaxID=2291710 RepID=UPI001B28E26F|nr:ATP-binding protein [Dokdonella sp.]MBO9661868.1 sensor histidine kinase N-terminal domain-containing protein [Dokdonella sp.]
MFSLKARITALVLGCLAAVLLPLVALSYRFTMEEVDELGDARLAQNARTIGALVSDAGAQALAANAPLQVDVWRRAHGKQPLTVRGHPYEMQIGFQYWDGANRLLLNSDNLAEVPLDAAPAGFADIQVKGRHWRVFTLLGENQHWVRVGERYDSRREIARALAVEAIAPLLIGVPLLALLLGWAVRRGLAPLHVLAERVAARRPDQNEPIGGSALPREIEPLVAALNGLFGRAGAQLRREREFTANAAHELRTPLAGALIQVENAQAAATPAAREQSLRQAALGLGRLSRLVNQMLELARWDAAQPPAFERVDLGRCIDEELAELGAAAADKDLEIAVVVDPAARHVDGWEPGLRTLLRNLLDNAMRHSERGGRIEVTLAGESGRARLAIRDHGPGIEPALRQAMLDRFRRGDDRHGGGSGLGLAIVARIAELHRTRLVLGEGEGGGLRVEVVFPAA